MVALKVFQTVDCLDDCLVGKLAINLVKSKVEMLVVNLEFHLVGKLENLLDYYLVEKLVVTKVAKSVYK
jgi:hypothetical protein